MHGTGRILGLALIAAALLGAAARDADPGLLIEIDRESFVLSARDLRDDVAGPMLRVAVGSPSHATPTGTFPLYQVVHDPAWHPGANARRRGAAAFAASADGPMGVAKLPFAPGGYAVHGGGQRVALGKPVSLGCVRLTDADVLELIAWMRERDALRPRAPRGSGERHEPLLRPAHVVIR
jgi:lipoprotein-anchoring transpeptidase ErfK/SrfK